MTLAGVTATMQGQIQASRLPSGSLSPAMQDRAARRADRPPIEGGRAAARDRLNLPAGSAATVLQVAGPVQPPKGMVRSTMSRRTSRSGI